ncbi:MAG TPA: tRNA pseudouridine(38-40) synthase TruA [Firmicutes bacterium]|nr:tRNA pseudouridine(38-40) synthase TruA [Candidatus Fermentithermobacillaceae bacterium]
MAKDGRDFWAEVRRIAAVVQYDGSRYAGFQRQAGDVTVQGEIEAALMKLLGHPVKVSGAGRTDAGVHARGQVIAFDTQVPIPAERLTRAIEGFLPSDISFVKAWEVERDFSPRKRAAWKTYCYRLWRLEYRSPLWGRYAYWYPGELQYDLMVEETKLIPGRQNFKAFRATGSSVQSTVRTVRDAYWRTREADGRDGAIWEFWITADGFLYKMVRLLVGTVLEVGRGKLPPGTVGLLLADPEEVERIRSIRRGQALPGYGLCLEEVILS